MSIYTLELSSEIDGKLTEIALRSGISKAEALKRALALLAIADDERQKNNGSSLGIVRKTGSNDLEAVAMLVGL